MRTFVLNGSPRADGNTAGMARRFAACLGGPCDMAGVYGLGVEACRACGGCAGGAGCVVADGMRAVWRGMDWADCIVLASPLHFSSLSGPLVSLIGRFQAAWTRFAAGGGAALADRKRFGVLLATGGAEYANMFAPARSVAAAAFVSLGVEFVGMAGIAGLDGGGEAVAKGEEELRALADKVLGRYAALGESAGS